VSAEFLWFRNEFPWLGPGFIHAVAAEYADPFLADLRGRGFTTVEIDGSEHRNLHDQLTDAFGLPDYRPEPTPRPPDAKPNWDALIDYFRDVAVPDHCALLGRAADQFAARHPGIFAEACVVLSGIFDGDLARNGSQVVLLLSGDGPDFARP
jgi:hypothetical protein